MQLILKIIGISFTVVFLVSCEKDKPEKEWIDNNYQGSYINMEYTETLIDNFTPGVYTEDQIPTDLKTLQYGRIEIDFTYNGGALESFMPILYFGSINKNNGDDTKEETQFHLVVEIGHYNVVPFSMENLFYTICDDRYPLYCRDTYVPVIAGEDYTFVIDKKPDGIILHLKKGEEILNSLPSAFFPDSSQLFFNDVSSIIEKERGDSLDLIMMVGKGFVGFAPGVHDFNGNIQSLKIYKYSLSSAHSGYELSGIKNQIYVGEKITTKVVDHVFGEGNLLKYSYVYQPYNYKNDALVPSGDPVQSDSKAVIQNEFQPHFINDDKLGFYQIYFETVNGSGKMLNKTDQPFEIWVYPEAWAFDY